MKIRPYQTRLFNSINAALNPLADICVAAPRQVGKSMSVQFVCLKFISLPNRMVIWTEPSHRQCKAMFNDIKTIYDKVDIGLNLKFRKGSLEITCNNSTLKFLSAQSADNLRSLHADLLVIDEAAYTPDEVIDLVQPFRINTQAPCIYCSTKLKKEGRFYEVFSDPDSAVFDIYPEEVITDFPEFTTIMEKFKTKLSPALYKIDYLNEFLDTSESLLFGNLEALVIPHTYNNHDLYVGIDWALNKSAKDRVSVSIGYKLQDTIVELATYRLNNGQGPLAAVDMVANILSPYVDRIKTVYSETNSIGGVQEDALRKKFPHLNIVSDWWNAVTKASAISALIALANSQHLHLNNTVYTAREEMKWYGMTITKNGKITYGNIRQSDDDNSFHDDTVCALAHMISAANSSRGNYMIR